MHKTNFTQITLAILFVIASFKSDTLNAQQYIGGEISCSADAGLYTFNVITYSVNAPNHNGILDYSDGGFSTLDFTSELIFDSIYKNSASDQRIFVFSGLFLVTFTSDELIAGVLNIEGSEEKNLYMEIYVTADYLSANSPPSYTNSLFDFSSIDECTILHSEAAFDVDGDSIAYNMGLFQVNNGTDIYSVIPNATDYILIDSLTGAFEWKSPTANGLFALEFSTEEYRAGQHLTSSQRKILMRPECFILDLADPSSQQNIVIKPNPTSSVLYIENISQSFEAEIRIIDLSGKLMSSEQTFIQNGTFQIKVDQLPNGIYFIQIQNESIFHANSFVKI